MGRMSLIFAIVSPMIRASAPARIDLAGGTLDIRPLCFAFQGPVVTINLAIDLRAEVEVEATREGLLEVESLDRGETVRVPAAAPVHNRLGLATRLAECYGIGEGLSIRMRCAAPPQSGLGGSSALAVALAGALAHLRGRAVDLRLVQDVETALLGLPTGYQDYYPALQGGLLALTAKPGGVAVERIKDAAEWLGRHLLLADTGMRHASGRTNWEAVKRFLDGDPATRAGFEGIRRTALEMRAAIADRDLERTAAALARDWELRREISPVVTNPRIDALVDAVRRAGAVAAKICGAGGGGCLAILTRDPLDPALREAVAGAGAQRLALRPASEGLKVA